MIFDEEGTPMWRDSRVRARRYSIFASMLFDSAPSAAWERTLINVVVEPLHFAEGSLRRAYHMTDLSVIGNDSRYVVKMSKDADECTSAYFNDVQMQIEAKVYADLYNANDPPKKVCVCVCVCACACAFVCVCARARACACARASVP